MALKDNLYGIYVFGSLTYGSFRPKSSDIDCMIVTNKILNNKEFNSLRKCYVKLLKENNQLTKRLEMSYAVKNNLLSNRVAKNPKFYNGKLNKEADSDANNPIAWLNIKQTGITVYGPHPEKFVPDIGRDTIRRALKTEFDYINQRPGKYLKEDWSKVYVILTFCRILYTLKTGKIKSKHSAAEWCLNNLPKKWYRLINSAIKSLVVAVDWKRLCHPAHGINEQSLGEIKDFSKYVSSQLNKKVNF